MTRSLLLATLLVTAPSVASAQMVVAGPPAPVDSGSAVVRDALFVLRDSLQAVQAAAAHLQRDFRGTSDEALISRARSMAAACTAAQRQLPDARAAVAGGPAPTERAARERAQLLGEMDRVATTLTDCEKTFGGWVDEREGAAVRDYGNSRAAGVRRPIRQYEVKMAGYLGSLGIRVLPAGRTLPAQPS